MNRTVVFGIAMLFAVVGLTLTGGQKEAEAGWGCRGGKRCRGASACNGHAVVDHACCGRRARRCGGKHGCRGDRADRGCRGRRERRSRGCCGEAAPACAPAYQPACCPTGCDTGCAAGCDTGCATMSGDVIIEGSEIPTESSVPAGGDPVPPAPAPKEASNATPLRVVSFR